MRIAIALVSMAAVAAAQDFKHALSATWNDPKSPVDPALLIDIVQDIVYMLQRR